MGIKCRSWRGVLQKFVACLRLSTTRCRQPPRAGTHKRQAEVLIEARASLLIAANSGHVVRDTTFQFFRPSNPRYRFVYAPFLFPFPLPLASSYRPKGIAGFERFEGDRAANHRRPVLMTPRHVPRLPYDSSAPRQSTHEK